MARQPVSIVVVGNTANEAQAIRAVLEVLDFQVEIHWIGSRREFLKVLSGEIKTHEYVVLSCQDYIAPSDYIEGDAALLFVIHLFYQIKKGCSVVDASNHARRLDSECGLFNLYRRDHT